MEEPAEMQAPSPSCKPTDSKGSEDSSQVNECFLVAALVVD
jgi:hypothetical protein